MLDNKVHVRVNTGVFGCVLTPLGELQSAMQYVTPLPSMTSGGKMAWRNGERFDMLFNCVCTVINPRPGGGLSHLRSFFGGGGAK